MLFLIVYYRLTFLTLICYRPVADAFLVHLVKLFLYYPIVYLVQGCCCEVVVMIESTWTLSCAWV